MKYCSRAAGQILLELVSVKAIACTPRQTERWSFAATKVTAAVFRAPQRRAPGAVHWSLFGEHNKANALNAVGGSPRWRGTKQAIDALCEFRGVKRRGGDLRIR